MDPKTYVEVEFKDVIWANPLGKSFKKDVKLEYLLDADDKMFPDEDLKDILKAWLMDETGKCPEDLQFKIKCTQHDMDKEMKTATKWAVHKDGTAQFGCLCSFRSEAEDMLEDMKKNIMSMPPEELAKYHVVEVHLSWVE